MLLFDYIIVIFMIIVNTLTIKYNGNMISYKPFWETLKKQNKTTYTLIYKFGISSATIDRMKKGNGISTAKIDDFCKILNCRVEDIIEYIPD